jgi:hypothetical protein
MKCVMKDTQSIDKMIVKPRVNAPRRSAGKGVFPRERGPVFVEYK